MVMASWYPVRFFRVVTPLPGLIVWTFIAVALVGAMSIGIDRSKTSGSMVPVLLLQVFAASSGFGVPARRGHYDLLLTAGHDRVWMALVHWGSSIAPGVATWLLLAVVEIVVSRGMQASLFASGTWAAMGLVSTLPWAITVRLPRFSGGIGWLLALAISSSVWPGPQNPGGSPSGNAMSVIASSWGFLVYPPSLVGHRVELNEAFTAMPALLLAACSMAAACRWVSRASVPLEAAQ